jgi:phosphohistidine phosphatase
MRVTETLEQIESGYGGRLAPTLDRRIYLASAATLLDVVHGFPPEAESALLIGHNPGLEDLVLMLVADGADPLRDALEDKYPTASIAELQFEGEWGNVAAGTVRLTRFIRPRDLDPTLGPDAD